MSQAVNLVQELAEAVKEYEVSRHSLFFNDTGSKKIYKNYLKTIILRENSINGRVYKDDPTIMSWGLLNEPRCETWKVSQNIILVLNTIVHKNRDNNQSDSVTSYCHNHSQTLHVLGMHLKKSS